MDEPDYNQELRYLESAQTYPGLERLICAALADPSLAAELLASPRTAVERVASVVQLSPVERALAISITGAADIHDFAARLLSKSQQEHARNG
jgi:hypothetical protein